MKKKKSQIALVGIILLGIVFLCLVYVVWKPENRIIPVEDFESHSYQPVPTDTDVISGIEANANIKLPPSAHEIYAYNSGFRDIFIMVRFSMDASELAAFMGSTLCEQPLVEIPQEPSVQEFDDGILQLRMPKPERGIPTMSPGDPDWWLHYQAQYAEECYGVKEHLHQHIVIDMSDQDVYIVYVSNSTY